MTSTPVENAAMPGSHPDPQRLCAPAGPADRWMAGWLHRRGRDRSTASRGVRTGLRTARIHGPRRARTTRSGTWIGHATGCGEGCRPPGPEGRRLSARRPHQYRGSVGPRPGPARWPRPAPPRRWWCGPHHLSQRDRREEDLPAEHPPSGTQAWLPPAHVHEGGPRRHPQPAPEGPQAPHRLTVSCPALLGGPGASATVAPSAPCAPRDDGSVVVP